MQKRVNLVDLVKSFQTTIYLQNSASIQPRTSLSKFAKTSPKVRKNVGPGREGRDGLALHRRPRRAVRGTRGRGGAAGPPPRAGGGGSRVGGRVERFDRRGTEPFEPFEPFEFFQNT